MTKSEKQTIINALKTYSACTEVDAKTCRLANDTKMTAYYEAEHDKAEAMLSVFKEILDKPCGTVKI